MPNPFTKFEISDLKLLHQYVGEAHANWKDFTGDEDCEASEELTREVERLGELVGMCRKELLARGVHVEPWGK